MHNAARVRGRARDLVTPKTQDAPRISAEGSLEAAIGDDCVYEALSTMPAHSSLQEVVGVPRTVATRSMIAQLIPDESSNGTPLFLLLDDLPGIHLAAGEVMLEWSSAKELRSGVEVREQMPTDVCAGYQMGSSAFLPDGGSAATHQVQAVEPLTRPDDDHSWHALLPEIVVPSMRRSRRIDVWMDDCIHVDAFFQDSCMTPSGIRVGVHEYTISATAHLRTNELLTINADPRILPFDECPGAARNVDRVLGLGLEQLRRQVPRTLPGTLGCTHLNDMLRALADVPTLLMSLRSRSG